MSLTLCLATIALALGQVPERAEWLLNPQLSVGQELVYSGTYSERSLAAEAQYQKAYRLESKVFVLAATADGWDLAVMTTLQEKVPRAPLDGKEEPLSLRLEQLHLDRHGWLHSKEGTSILVPLDGPPTLECSSFFQAPRTRVGTQHYWEVAEPGRTPRVWRVLGTEVVNTAACVKLVGTQQSHDWEQPRADLTAWKRIDTLWVAPQTGLAARVERVLEKRDPARQQPTYRTTARYDLDSRWSYTGQLLEARRAEIQQALKLQRDAQPLLMNPALYHSQLEQLRRKIAHAQDLTTPTPYRQAIKQLLHRLEAAQQGKITVVQALEPAAAPQVATPGQRVPDFIANDLLKQEPVRLHRLLGRPVVVVFYNPGSPIGQQAIRFAQSIRDKHKEEVAILGMAVTDDAAAVRKQCEELKLSFPILDGHGLHRIFGVESIPRFIVIDRDGIVRGGFTGWGRHVPGEVQEEIQRCLPKAP